MRKVLTFCLILAPLVANGAGYSPATSVSGGLPGGLDTQVQFNDTGAFAGDAGLVYNKTAQQLTLGTLLLGVQTTFGRMALPPTIGGFGFAISGSGDTHFPTGSTYHYFTQSPGFWTDAHALHLVANGAMDLTPDPTIFRNGLDPLGGTGDALSMDFHVNTTTGTLIERKPIIYFQNIDDIYARITMADEHPIAGETAVVRLGKGLADLEALDPAVYAGGLPDDTDPRPPAFKLTLDGANREFRIVDGSALRLNLSLNHLDVWGPQDYGGGGTAVAVDFQGPNASPTPGVVGDGQAIRIRLNDSAASLITTGTMESAWVDPTAGTYSSKITLAVARQGNSAEGGVSGALVFDGSDLSLRAYDGGTLVTTFTGPTFVDNEIPAGLINSSNVTYTIVTAPSPVTSLHLYLRGVRLRPTIDYTLAGTTITMAVAPTTGDWLYADYRD